MAEVIEIALHSRVRRILQLFLRRHGLDFFLTSRSGEHFSRIDPRKVDLVLALARRGNQPVPMGVVASVQEDSARSMVRRILIRRLASQMVEAGG